MSNWFYANDNEGDFFPIADLMSALMAVFMCATIIIILNLQSDYRSSTDIQQAVMREFQQSILNDLEEWDAEFFIDQGYMRFNATFQNKEETPSTQFSIELDDFCPKLKQLLERHPKLFKEVRVEGHTSNQWAIKKDAFIGNMGVSQRRALNTMNYCLQTSDMMNIPTLRNKFTGVGMSFKKPVIIDGSIHWPLSRRVEFWFVFHDSKTLLDVVL